MEKVRKVYFQGHPVEKISVTRNDHDGPPLEKRKMLVDLDPPLTENTILHFSLKDDVIEIRIPPEASDKHVLLLGRTGSGKSLLGNVLIDKYCGSDSFLTASSPTTSQTQETFILGNIERRVKIYDTKGFFDWSDWGLRTRPKTEEERTVLLAKEYQEIWETVANSEGIDSVALVLPAHTRFDGNDAQLARMAAKNLFNNELINRRLFIVVTFSKLDLNQDIDSKIIRSEMEKNKFTQFFDLVNSDPERVVFVNNIDPNIKNSSEEKKKAEINNIKMAEKVLKVIHRFDGGPIPLDKKIKKVFDRQREMGISDTKKENDARKLEEKARRKARRVNESAKCSKIFFKYFCCCHCSCNSEATEPDEVTGDGL